MIRQSFLNLLIVGLAAGAVIQHPANACWKTSTREAKKLADQRCIVEIARTLDHTCRGTHFHRTGMGKSLVQQLTRYYGASDLRTIRNNYDMFGCASQPQMSRFLSYLLSGAGSCSSAHGAPGHYPYPYFHPATHPWGGYIVGDDN